MAREKSNLPGWTLLEDQEQIDILLLERESTQLSVGWPDEAILHDLAKKEGTSYFILCLDHKGQYIFISHSHKPFEDHARVREAFKEHIIGLRKANPDVLKYALSLDGSRRTRKS